MPRSDPALEDLLKKTSRSMYLSLALLPKAVREPMGLGYLLCRAADTIADTRLLPQKARLKALESYRAAFDDAETEFSAAGMGLASDGSAAERDLLLSLPDCLAAYHRRPAEERELLKEVLSSVVKGMRFDLSFFPGDRAEDLRALDSPEQTIRYCELIGGAPGLFWAKLCRLKLGDHAGEHPEELRDAAFSLGKGLQMTNILRDLAQDLRIGRCYFPLGELRASGLEPKELLDPNSEGRFRGILTRWTRWASEQLQEGENYVVGTPGLRLKAAAAWPLLLALRTLKETAASPNPLNPELRAKVPRAQVYKLILWTPWTLLSNARFKRDCANLREKLEAVL